MKFKMKFLFPLKYLLPIIVFLGFLVIALTSCAPQFAIREVITVYYVSPSGSGTACTNAIPCALTTPSLSPGATLYLKGGTYSRSIQLTFNNSGLSNNRIVISSAPGEHAIISGDTNGNGRVDLTDGPGSSIWTPLVYLSGSYITFQNIEVAYSSGRGLQSGGHDNILLNNEIHHAWNEGIYLWGSDNIADGNTVYRTGESNYCEGGSRGCNGIWSGGLVWGAPNGTGTVGQNAIIRNNIVYHASGEGIMCIQTTGSIVENNIGYDNWAVGMYLDQCSYATVKDNYIYYTDDKFWWRGGAPSSGIIFGNEGNGGYSISPHDETITGNLLVHVGRGVGCWGCGNLSNWLVEHNTIVNAQYSFELSSGGIVKNNIVNQSSGTVVLGGSGVSFSYNLWYPLNGITGLGDIRQDPQFTSDYHLQSSSPACTGGENGMYMGAYLCNATIRTPTFTLIPPTVTTKTPVASPAGKLFGPFDYPAGAGYGYTLTRSNYRVSNLQIARDNNVKAFVAVTGSKSNYYTNGCFDIQKWKNVFDSRSGGLQEFVDDGTIVGLYAIDEPDNESGCGEPTYEELNEVCRYAKEKLPGIPCGFNTEPAWLEQGKDVLCPDDHCPYMDVIYEQTNFGRVARYWGGDWSVWAGEQFADADGWFDGKLYLGINAYTGYSHSPTDDQLNDAAIELCNSDAAGVLMWKWDYVQQRDMSRAIAACSGVEVPPTNTPQVSTQTPIFTVIPPTVTRTVAPTHTSTSTLTPTATLVPPTKTDIPVSVTPSSTPTSAAECHYFEVIERDVCIP